MNLSKAIDRAIANRNRQSLADREAVDAAQRMGEAWRIRLEDEGILPKLDCACSEYAPCSEHQSKGA